MPVALSEPRGVDLAASGARPDDVGRGIQELNVSGILVAGIHRGISGPAGRGTELVASEFYVPERPMR